MTLEISQGRFAELAGVALHTVWNLETERENTTEETLLTVAQVLGYAVRIEP